MKLDLLNLLKGLGKPRREREDKNTKGCPEKPDPRQTDSATTSTSGDSRERPAFDFKRIPDVDDKTVEAFFSATHEGSRRMPLLVAQWVYAQLEDELTSPVRLDERRLAEIRGGMMALRRFAVFYTQGIEAWKQRKKPKKDDEE